MQGRVDVIELLLAADIDGQIKHALAEEKSRNPPSLVHLALANDYLNAADWSVNTRFSIGDYSRKISWVLYNMLCCYIATISKGVGLYFGRSGAMTLLGMTRV